MFLRGRELVSRTADGERVLMTRDEMQLRGTAQRRKRAGGDGRRSWRVAPRRNLCAKRSATFNRSSIGWRKSPKSTACVSVNDSKATSVDATIKALEAFADDRGKVVLILGGRGKQAPYAPLARINQGTRAQDDSDRRRRGDD